MRKLAFSLCFAFLLAITQPIGAFALQVGYSPDEERDFKVNSQAVYLYNTDTDTVVYQKEAQKQFQPASTAKIMTCILTLENVPDLEAEITYPSAIFGTLDPGVSQADVRPGETLTYKKALYCLMLQSDCYSAIGLADDIGGGDVGAFVEMMNAKAKELGALNTTFTNPHGLYDEGMSTTAYDLFLITKYAMELDGFMDICSTSTIDLAPTNKHAADYDLYTTVKPMVRSNEYYYEPLKGIKTGTLEEVGRNFVSSASKNGYSYILVLLGAPINDASGEELPENLVFIDTKNIYEWAFNNFETKELLEKGKTVNSVPVRLSKDADTVNLVAAENFSTLVPSFVDNENGIVVTFKDKPESLEAPIKRGQKVCTAEIRLNTEILGTVDLLADTDLSRSQTMYMLDWVKNLFSSIWMKFALVLLVLLIAFYVTIMIMRNRYRSRRARGRRHR